MANNDAGSKSPKRKLTKQIEIFFKDAVDNIRFSKAQQWKVTNYVLIVYGAIYLMSRNIEDLSFNELVFLFLLTATAFCLGLFYIFSYFNFMTDLRKRLYVLYENYFSEEECDLFGIEIEDTLKGDNDSIGITHCGIIFIGAVIVFYLLLKG